MAGGGIRPSDRGSGETELSLLVITLPEAEEGLMPPLLFDSRDRISITVAGSLVRDGCLRRVSGFMAGDCLTLLLPPDARADVLGLRRWRLAAEVGITLLPWVSFRSIGDAVVPVDSGPRWAMIAGEVKGLKKSCCMPANSAIEKVPSSGV